MRNSANLAAVTFSGVRCSSEVLLLLRGRGVACSCAGRHVSAAAPAQASPQFEALPLIRSKQNHLLVRASINGKEAWLGVDSGAPVSAISLRVNILG